MSDLEATIVISKAIHAALSANGAVTALLGTPPRLYDNPPEDPVFPYLTYGPIRSEDISGDGAVITNHIMTLHIWSRYGGRAEAMNIVQVISEALVNIVLPPGDIHLTRKQLIYTDIFRAPDGQTLHGLIRFSLTTDKEEAA